MNNHQIKIRFVISCLAFLLFLLLNPETCVKADDGSLNLCVNTPPDIYNITYSLNAGPEISANGLMSFTEGDSVSLFVYAQDSDGNEIQFKNYTNYYWNGSSPPALDVYTFAPGIGRINFQTLDYFGNNQTFYTTLTLRAIDDSNCTNKYDDESVLLVVNPFDNRIQFRSWNPSNLGLTMNEGENITFSAVYYEPDNNASLWINYPDVTDPQNNNDIDDDIIYMNWILNDVLVSSEILSDYRVTGTTRYNFSTGYSSAGLYSLIIRGNSTPSYYNTDMSWNITVNNVNRWPYFNKTIPDYTWFQRNTFRALYLEDFVRDPDIDINDGDYLSFSVNHLSGNNITVAVNPEPPFLVVFSQPQEYNGTEIISFTVTDSHGASNTSNNITLTVLHLGASSADGDKLSSRDSIGPDSNRMSGGREGFYEESIKCEEQWYCVKWVCKPDNKMYRACYDLNYCGTFKYKPETTGECEYIPKCFDGIQNQEEDGIDCGGPCPPCWTCYDRIMNQGEEGIDCGGPCKACPGCFDGILNQGEEEIDCGGPCPSCGNCSDGVMNQDEEGIDCGGRCPQCKESELQMGVNLKVGKHPLEYITLVSIFTTLLILAITLSYKYAPGFIHQMGTAVTLMKQPKPKSKKIPKAVHIDISKKILSHLNRLGKVSSNYSNSDIDSLNSLMREYIISIFSLEKGFTVGELRLGLEKKNVDAVFTSIMVSFFRKITNLSYSGQTLLGMEFRSLVLEAKELVYLTMPGRVHKKTGHKKRPVRILRTDAEEIFRIISLSYEELSRGDSHNAGECYHKSLEIYEKLPDGQKQDVYGSIKRLHDEIDLYENKFS